MTKTDLKRFARQLALWAELAIEHGRTPFRRLDLFPTLNTRMGQFQPPLVFWINRQSLMAGGVILLPDNDLPRQMDLGCATADALGLQHFVTWETDRIRIWKATGTTAREEKQFSVAASDDPEIFRARLLEVMEQLKLFSVLGMVPASDLSPSYLHNLFQETLNSALASLIASFRKTRAEGQLLETIRADRQADQLNHLTLLRLLALLWHDRLPGSILPEKLEWAMELALPSLPLELHQSLAFPQENRGPALPIDSAVCYHHLQLRLRQIRWNSPPERALQAINQFLNPVVAVVEPTFIPSGRREPLLQINPDTPLLGHSELHELSDSPSFLAAAALLRHINKLSPAQQYSGNLFTFTAPPLPALQVQGKLINNRKIPRDERQHYDALLRASWPTRRFNFLPDTPCWVMETTHLLGLSPAETQLQLEIPTTWLTAAFGQILWELIMDSFQLQRVTLGDGTTVLQLLKQKPVSVITTIRGLAEERQIDWNEQPALSRSLLLLSLILTSEQYQLYLSDKFEFCSESSASPVIDTGLQVYSKSHLGQCLWKILGGDKIPYTASELRQQGIELAWPIPCEDILYELGCPISDETALPASAENLDRRLAELLGSSVPIDIFCPQLPQLADTSSARRQTSTGNHREEILHHLDACGLPDFPHQYFYQLENPQLTTYRFKPPLQIVSELLGQFELVDTEQKRFPVRGESTVDALNLCAEQGRCEVELPEDQQQLNAILTSYRNDLRHLRQELTRQTHTRLENPQAADRLAKKLWKELNLPAWKWLDQGH